MPSVGDTSEGVVVITTPANLPLGMTVNASTGVTVNPLPAATIVRLIERIDVR